MTPYQFIQKWRPVSLTERATAQTHFIDLCALLGHPDPIAADPDGSWFTFEKGVTKTGGGDGFADVWKKGAFAWEYKKKKRNLEEAMAQLVRYAAALENPPLQIACDTDRFLIRTAWTNSVPTLYPITLEELADPQKLQILHWVFFEPDKLRPQQTRAALTKDAADKFSAIALSLQDKGPPDKVAHFINQLVFCFFANSVRLLPPGFLHRILQRASEQPDKATSYFDGLFAAMEKGGEFALTQIAHFNGGLFDGRGALPLAPGDIQLLADAAALDWSHIDPTIFGTLFERFLDPGKRAQIGQHYTDADKISVIIDAVIVRQLQAEWVVARKAIEALLGGETTPPMRSKPPRRRMTPREAADEIRAAYLERLRKLTVLDPACGSGNFLYLALQAVKDLENRAILECEALGLAPQAGLVGPEILHGIEINPLAAELARTTVWIGDIQWGIRNGVYTRPQPILRPLAAIECRDALVAHENGNCAEASWPDAEFIVGNPPFLGSRKMAPELGADYVADLREAYKDRVARGADLVCYWFAKAWQAAESGVTRSVGLLATRAITGGASRKVLAPIASENCLFDVWRDQPWVVEGANVRVAIICFAGEPATAPRLDGREVETIYSDLRAPGEAHPLDLTTAGRLQEAAGIAFQGVVPRGSLNKKSAAKLKLPPATFVLPADVAREMLQMPLNPNGRPNSDVIVPWLIGKDITSRPRDHFIVDFRQMSEAQAALYEAPFEYIRAVKLHRAAMTQSEALATWWQHWRTRNDMRDALNGLSRFIATPRVSKHRIFVWMNAPMVADNGVVVIARDDDTSFGILQSKFHGAWALRQGTALEDRPRYTPTTTFQTFPFPLGLEPNVPAASYADDSRAKEIAKAAKELDALRTKWLNPADIVKVQADVIVGLPDRLVPVNNKAAAILKQRTMTKLYNNPPQWLIKAHEDLDAAVAKAYGWAVDISEEEALAKLLTQNSERGAVEKASEAELEDDVDDEEDEAEEDEDEDEEDVEA